MRVEHIGDATLYLADCREVLPTLDPVDVVIADPPYSSGGAMRSDRNMNPADKYRMTNTQKVHPHFSGDNRDQRSFTLWCSDWMAQCLQVTKPGGAMMCFIDWRNLPCVVDAVQVGGWVYRGIIPWNKTESARPQKGWFRAQCEYIITASAGTLSTGQDVDGICAPGFFSIPVNGVEKLHLTEKPVDLLTFLVTVRNEWRVILDPFMGSGTTGSAAIGAGLSFVGIENTLENFDIACRRIEKAWQERSLINLCREPARPQQAALMGV